MPIDHQAIVLDKFNGLYVRGDADSCPPDHFPDCNNIAFSGSTSFKTRPGVNIFQHAGSDPLKGIRRIYNYITQNANTLLILNDLGEIYHVVDSTTMYGPILTIATMDDFGFTPYNGRAYITPFKTETNSQGQKIQRGITGEFLYVYLGDGTNARKAAGAAYAGTLSAANSASAGNTDAGVHLFAIVLEYDTGYLSPPGPTTFAQLTTLANKQVTITFTAFAALTHVVAIRVVATAVIPNYDGNQTGYTFYFVPDGRVTNSAATTVSFSFFDADLLDDASHLIDNFTEIAAGVGLTIYHDRLVLYTQHDDISLLRVSEQGEPEAINQINGLCIAPLDGNPITNAHELRDILYVFKRNRTVSFTDNGDVPSSWPLTIIDQALGTGVHGVATVLDSGASNVDYLITCSYRGMEVFSGRYMDPELSWKIFTYWTAIDRNEFQQLQLLNDPTTKTLYLTLPNKKMLIGDYGNGISPKAIRWAPWEFDIQVNTIALLNTGQLIIGSEAALDA